MRKYKFSSFALLQCVGWVFFCKVGDLLSDSYLQVSYSGHFADTRDISSSTKILSGCFAGSDFKSVFLSKKLLAISISIEAFLQQQKTSGSLHTAAPWAGVLRRDEYI